MNGLFDFGSFTFREQVISGVCVFFLVSTVVLLREWLINRVQEQTAACRLKEALFKSYRARIKRLYGLLYQFTKDKLDANNSDILMIWMGKPAWNEDHDKMMGMFLEGVKDVMQGFDQSYVENVLWLINDLEDYSTLIRNRLAEFPKRLGAVFVLREKESMTDILRPWDNLYKKLEGTIMIGPGKDT